MATINGTSYTAGSYEEAVAMYEGLVEAQDRLSSGHEEVLFAGRKYVRSNMADIDLAISRWETRMLKRKGGSKMRMRRLVPRSDL